MVFVDSFDNFSNFPFASPPAPAPGPSLLDDTESSMLGNFFDRVSSASFDNTDYLLEKSIPTHGESELGFGWAQGLLPTYQGHTTLDFSRAASQVQPVKPDPSPGQFLAQPGLLATTASEDVLQAASTLSQNANAQLGGNVGANLLFPASHVFRGFNPSSAHQASLNESSVPGSSQLLSSVPRIQLEESGQQMFPPNLSHSYNQDVAFSSSVINPSPALSAPSHQQKPIDVRWGSDVSFLDHGYVAPPEQETEEEVTKGLIQNIKYMVPESSANNTRPPSPSILDPPRNTMRPTVYPDGVDETPSAPGVRKEDRATGRKRRRSEIKDESGNSDGSADDKAPVKVAKVKTAAGRSRIRTRKPPPSESSSKEGNALSGSHKLTRENLSEQQKRSNHIQSEQRRRNLIKQGFDDLCTLVPSLRTGGHSKSGILVQAADWLEDLLKGNEELKVVLESLKSIDTI